MCTTWKGRSHAIGSCSLAFLYCDPVAWRMWPASVTALVPAAVDHPCQLPFFFSFLPLPPLLAFVASELTTATPLQAPALHWTTRTAFFLCWLSDDAACCKLLHFTWWINKSLTPHLDAFSFLPVLQHCGSGFFFMLQHTCSSSEMLP